MPSTLSGSEELGSSSQSQRSGAQRDCDSCAVRSLSICAGIEAGDFKTFRDLGQSEVFDFGGSLFREGDPSQAVYSITEGMVRMSRVLADGRRCVIGFAMPGDFIGLPQGSRHTYSADAVDRTVACRFERDAFVAFAGASPKLLLGLHTSALRWLDLARDQITMVGSANVRLAAFLLWVRERSGRLGSRSALVRLPMLRRDIADFLGMTIFTVSRTLSRLGRQHLIVVVPGGVRILDLPRIERLAGR